MNILFKGWRALGEMLWNDIKAKNKVSNLQTDVYDKIGRIGDLMSMVLCDHYHLSYSKFLDAVKDMPTVHTFAVSLLEYFGY